MSHTWTIIENVAITVVGVASILFILWLRLKKSQDPWATGTRWIYTAVVLFVIFHVVYSNMTGLGQLVGLAVGVLGGIALAIVWVPAIVDGVARKIGSLYDGGDLEIEARPLYSTFEALRKQGKYDEALVEIGRQLEKFPQDMQGQMFLAALQAENLKDLPGAEATVLEFCAQPGHAPLNIAYACNCLADWYLTIDKDRDSARRAFEKIIELLPDTEMSLQAAQRIGRLAQSETVPDPREHRTFTVAKGVENIGLMRGPAPMTPADADPEKTVVEYVKHLEQHPLDSHVREMLAVLYANHYQRLDMATDQLEQLINQPHQPAKQVVRWLNLLADLQVEHGVEPELIRATLQRIVDRDPNMAAAGNARRRMDVINFEIKAQSVKKNTDAVKLGTYEQNIGLKGRRMPR